jgi:diacylglycerol kinase (ATP)
MLDPKNREQGMNLMREEVEKTNKNVRVIAGGGDGTVMWVVEEMKKHRIPFQKCPLGTIPFGTGNDFSRVIGWGAHEPNFRYMG